MKKKIDEKIIHKIYDIEITEEPETTKIIDLLFE
jgi:hypothetical protein